MAADNLFDLKIITPDRVFYSGKASFLELNTVEGGIGIYKNHIPMTTVLEPGIATITEEGGNKKEAALHTADYINGLLRMHAVDEIILYTVPFISGSGRHFFKSALPEQHWTLSSLKSYPNGVCRSIYTLDK